MNKIINCLKINLFAVLLLHVVFSAEATTVKKIQTSGAPSYPSGGRFYGYASSSVGPGDSAFADVLKIAEDNHAPMFIIYGKDDCSVCDGFAYNLNLESRDSGQVLGYKGSINAYFRGNNNGPTACNDCLNFLVKELGATSDCHLLAIYGVCGDGIKYKKIRSLTSDYWDFAEWKVAETKSFIAFAEQHQYVPPVSNVAPDYLKYCIVTSGDPRFPAGYFYGYCSLTNGPGSDAFCKCCSFAQENDMPLLIIWGKDNCSTCSAFAKNISEMSNSASIALGSMKCVNGYFRGSDDGKSPQACKEARDFFDTHLGGAKAQCHLMGFYAVLPDGTKFTKSDICSSDLATFGTKFKSWVTEYKSAKEDHAYVEGSQFTYRCKVSGDPGVSHSVFYGYNTPTLGPGDDAFKKCLDVSKENKVPLLIWFGKDSCSTCDSFIDYANVTDNGIGTLLGHTAAVNCYFRMNSQLTAPAAGVEAWEYVKKLNSGKEPSHHIIYIGGQFEDGVTYLRTCALNLDWLSILTSVQTVVADYNAEYMLHVYTPPTSVWSEGEKITLELLDSTQNSIAKNWIYFVKSNGQSTKQLEYGTISPYTTYSSSLEQNCFKLIGNCGQNCVIDLTVIGDLPSGFKPYPAIFNKSTDGNLKEVSWRYCSIFYKNGTKTTEYIYSINQSDVNSGTVYVGIASEKQSSAATTGSFKYTLKVRNPTANSGIATFAKSPAQPIIMSSSTQTYQVPLYRMFGSEGSLTVNVSVDSSSSSSDRYEINTNSITWNDGEIGFKYLPVTLKGQEAISTLKLNIDGGESITGLNNYLNKYTIFYIF